MQIKIVGIVNVTRDSFSDGGLYLDSGAAIQRALELVKDGADVVELGAASSHPDAERVGVAEEIRRLEPVIGPLQEAGVELSVDSYEPETQRYALARNVSYLNDIQGFANPELYDDLARAAARLVVMHSVQPRGPATRAATDPERILSRIDSFFERRVRALQAAGVRRDRLVLDPGMGFFLGNDPAPSLLVLRNLRRLRERFGLPVLVSVSRKSFLGALTGRPTGELLPASLAAELYAAGQGIDYLRTHDVRSLRDGLRVLSAL